MVISSQIRSQRLPSGCLVVVLKLWTSINSTHQAPAPLLPEPTLNIDQHTTAALPLFSQLMRNKIHASDSKVPLI